MVILRPARWPDDLAGLDRLDTSFTTDRVYRVQRDELAFRLIEEWVDPPLRKDYGPISAVDSQLPEAECALMAEENGAPAGFAAAEYVSWNRRVIVQHLYVDSGWRRRGVGTALMNALDEFARSAGARCLWVETQNVNYAAIRFYRRSGFRLCGLDDSLYDPAGASGDEVALFFVRDVPRNQQSTGDGSAESPRAEGRDEQ
jgi:ribosomal protein S18 acetylase RimI-like enzyme